MEVDGGRAEVGVTELPLNDVQRHALASELERMCVTQLVRGEAPPDPARGSPTSGSAEAMTSETSATARWVTASIRDSRVGKCT